MFFIKNIFQTVQHFAQIVDEKNHALKSSIEHSKNKLLLYTATYNLDIIWNVNQYI